jgi:hypothetical protein
MLLLVSWPGHPIRIPRPDYLSSFCGATPARHGFYLLDLNPYHLIMHGVGQIDDALIACVRVV